MKSDIFKCLNIQNIFSLVCVLGCSLPDNLPEIIANLPSRRDDTKTQHHTISDILAKHLTINETTNLLFEPDQIFHRIRILPHRSNSSEFKDYCRFNKFYYQKCSSDIQVHVEEVNLYPDYIFLMQIMLDHKFSKRFRRIRVSFVERGGVPASRQLKWLPIRTEKTPTVHLLNFFSVKTKMLPFPGYSCVNYNETAFETRDAKLVGCFNRLSLEKFGQIFHSSPVLADSNLRFATSDQLFDPNYRKTVDQILSRCEKEAILYDCSSERYIIRTRVPVKSPNQFTHILLEPTKSPNIETRAQRAVTFLDCVIAVGGESD
uniref:Uncharacterized protein n=1 Tax=Tetranychus urticae TaxID=32264 RepID=T1K2U6_TETUR